MTLIQKAAFLFASSTGQGQMLAQWCCQAVMTCGQQQGETKGEFSPAGLTTTRQRLLRDGLFVIRTTEVGQYGGKKIAEQLDIQVTHNGQRVFEFTRQGERSDTSTPRLINQPVMDGRTRLYVHGAWSDQLPALAGRRIPAPLILRF